MKHVDENRPTPLTDIMTVLVVAITVDTKIHDEEIDLFTKITSRLKLEALNGTRISEPDARAWFDDNIEHIKDKYFGPPADFENWFSDLLNRLKTSVKVDALIHAVEMISFADGDYHFSEANLIGYLKVRLE